MTAHYDMYPKTWSNDKQKYSGGLGYSGYEDMSSGTATATEIANEEAKRRELAEQRESLSPAVAHQAMVGAAVEAGA